MRVYSQIQSELDNCKLPYEITNGTKHLQIRIKGYLLGTIPRTSEEKNKRLITNIVCRIRRFVKQVKQEN